MAKPPLPPKSGGGVPPPSPDPDPVHVPLGMFSEGQRLTSPSGAFVVASRPVSQLSVRLRGVSPGALEDNSRLLSPDVVSCGSLQLCRSRLASRGSKVIFPPSEDGGNPLTTRLRSVTDVPKIPVLLPYVAAVKGLLRVRKRPSVEFKTPADRQNAIHEVFAEQTDLPQLHVDYQESVLQSGESLLCEPTVCVGIQNITEQPQLSRCATLLHALLHLKCKIECGSLISIAKGKELENLAPLQRLFGHSREPSEPNGARDRLHYYEAVRHIAVGYHGQFYEMGVVEPGGRTLESSEIAKGLQSIVDDEARRTCPLPFGTLSGLQRDEFVRRVAEISNVCLSNRMCFDRLNSALLFVSLSAFDEETGETPTVGPDDDAQWLPNTLRLVVLPNGNAILKGSALISDATILSAVAQWVAAAANTDPMLEYHPPPPKEMQVRRVVRHETPTAPGKRGPRPSTPSLGKIGKHARTGSQEEELSEVIMETVAVPGPEPASAPRHLPLWMPLTFCEQYRVSPVRPFRARTFELSLRHEHVLHLAAVLAVREVKKRTPFVHAVSYSVMRDPAVRLCLSPEIDNALRHTLQFMTFGPLPREVRKACGEALRSLRAIVQQSAPHISDLRACLRHGILATKRADGMDADTRRILAPSDLALMRVDDFTLRSSNASAGISWILQTPLHPSESGPFVSYFSVPAYQSSLRGALGELYTCTLVYRADDDTTDDAMEGLVQLLSMYARYWDERL